MRTPRRKSAACSSFAGRFACSKRMKLAPGRMDVDAQLAQRRRRRARARATTSRARSATSSGRASRARAISAANALRLYGSWTLRSSAQSAGAASMQPARRLAAASALEKVRKSTSRG